MISVKDISVKYKSTGKRKELKTLAFDFFHRRMLKKADFLALKSISFSACEGEIVGIIGANGAGKSTLCRVLSNIIVPDSGYLKVDGMVSALLSLGTGFNANLSGRENIYLNGMMLGFSKKKIDSLVEEIISFSGICDFIEQPIKKYSKGMRSRLGFSIAAMLEPDYLVIDETLSVGDAEFIGKASKKMEELINKAKIVFIVTHSLQYIEEQCTKAIWIDKGKIKNIGNPKQICNNYRNSQIINKRVKILSKFNQTVSSVTDVELITVKNIGIKYKINSKDFWALKNISFSLKGGEILGIIGHNGAGKSTLCKVLSKIFKPDAGEVHIYEKTTELLGFGSGFNRYLNGSDNIFLNGLFLGISRRKIQSVYDDIVNFSELNDSIDKPLNQYSSGMISRLGFSIATSIDPQILIIDEALSAGDYSFQEKAATRIQEILSNAKAVVVVTHNLNFVKEVCTRALWLHKGQLVYDGDPSEAIRKYKKSISDK